jgi:sugar phosphate isomerase/epimerase
MSNSPLTHPDRRTFLKAAGAAAVAAGAHHALLGTAAVAGQTRPNVRLGLDMYSVGAQQWTPFEQMDFAAKWQVKMVHFSEIRFLGSSDWQVALAPDNLRKVRAYADTLNLDIEIGMRSICPTSSGFDKAAGTAEEQIGRMVDAAKIVKSPIVRCVLGSQADRTGPIEKHIESTVQVLRNVRSKIVDAGVKIAIENHAGDMQARELKMLIDTAGKEYVGVCIDSGNAVWTIEDPHLTLEVLAPYVLTSHMRDSYVFNAPGRGTAVQWCRMGEGNIGMEDYIKKYLAQCPGAAVSLEVIVSNTPRVFNYRDPQAWAIFQTTPAWEFARFLALCDRGTPRELPPPGQGRGGGGGGRGGAPNPEAQRINREHVEASLQWTKDALARLAV